MALVLFYTEHPGAFLKVRDVCSTIHAPILMSIAIRYGYMPGYSEFNEFEDIYEEPKDPYLWFNGTFSPLDSLELVSVNLPWSAGLLGALTTLDLSHFDDLNWDFFTFLFAAASSLKFLRLDKFSQCAVPEGAKIRLTSLVVVDLGFGGNRCRIDLLIAFNTPNVTDLALRDICANLPDILRCDVCLRSSFALLFTVASPTNIPLSTIAPYSVCSTPCRCFRCSICTTHSAIFSPPIVYGRRTKLGLHLRAPLAFTLRALYISCVCLPQLLVLILFHGANNGSTGNHMKLRTLQILPSLPTDDPELLDWFKYHVSNFGFIRFIDRTLSVLPGPSYHFFCCFLP
ncbi:hypothetical protein B0H17DRAFT_1212548 [Mycena rosella]|uniref:Uncharacterized protein n=1 Tax=Mycena rosella TaxID=1033263 RepID=A0AAD7CSZ7_MYCRO|nr:hypothetical protein B0H17DRAFT_1212548 [Mycena rosella]